MLSVTPHFVPNDDGWLLHLEQAVDLEAFDPSKRPVAIIPGYGMNSFIFGFHPGGTSMRHALTAAGFEVWSLNLRGQGASRPASKRAPSASLRAYADIDLVAALKAISARTQSSTQSVDLIGASLGGSIAYALVALRPECRVGSVVAIGSPLRWEHVHPAIRMATSSPTLVGLLRFSRTRELAKAALPMLARTPKLLSPYMNAANVDMSAVADLVQTVEDPEPQVNRDIARWVQERDLYIRDVNITKRLAHVEIPLLIVQANRDGIVPQQCALSVLDAWGGATEVLHVGDEARWYSHADLFVGHNSVADVFTPLASWLSRTNLERPS